MGPSPAADLVTPVAPRTWRGIVRLGLVSLVAGEAPAVAGALAETLRLDGPALHAAQNAFQRLVVLAACLLLLHQLRATPSLVRVLLAFCYTCFLWQD